jgi:hypothetical protein
VSEGIWREGTRERRKEEEPRAHPNRRQSPSEAQSNDDRVREISYRGTWGEAGKIVTESRQPCQSAISLFRNYDLPLKIEQRILRPTTTMQILPSGRGAKIRLALLFGVLLWAVWLGKAWVLAYYLT